MANNRLYLKCCGCGDSLFLGKSFSCGFYWHDYGVDNGEAPDPLQDRLNRFYDKHAWCSKCGDGDFVLEYECECPLSWEKNEDGTWSCEGCGYTTSTRTKYCPICGRQLGVIPYEAL